MALEMDNYCGIAPGFIINLNQNRIVCFPGVPFELKNMFNEYHTSILKGYTRKNIHFKEKFLWNMSESRFQLEFIEPNRKIINDIIEWGVAPKRGYLRISFRSEQMNYLNNVIDIFEQYYKEQQTDEIIKVLQNKLSTSNQKIIFAESCTGGLLGKLITDLAGSSDFFLGSIVSYDNSIKTKILGVKDATILEYGAVSSQTAKEMANGAMSLSNADFAVSITGIAGPAGGTTDKPVGLIYIGVASVEGVKVYHHHFGDDREKNRELAAHMALYYLNLEI